MIAQTTTSYTVQRGETLESVAKKYGISVDELQQANPLTKEYFYSGMKLTIPSKSTSVQTQSPNLSTPSRVNTVAKHPVTSSRVSSLTSPRQSSEKSIKKEAKRVSRHSNIKGSDFTSAGVILGYDISKLVGLVYGVRGQYFLNNKLGATLDMGFNYGVSDPDIQIKLGPSYVYPLNDKFYLMGTACYTLTVANYEGNHGAVSGISIIPTAGISIKKFKIGLNLDLRWRNGGGVGAGIFCNVGYSFLKK